MPRTAPTAGHDGASRAALTRAVDLALEGAVVPSFSRIGHAVRSQLEGWEPAATLLGDGRRVLITGANSGLGYATAQAVLAAGGEVIGTVRSVEKAEATARRLREQLGTAAAARARFEVLDLEDLASVQALTARLPRDAAPIDTVIHNAGAMYEEHGLTTDGLERTYQVHVVAPFLLTVLLLPELTRTSPGRLITVTSGGMYTEPLNVARLGAPDDHRATTAYARAKRAQVALTAAWAERIDPHHLNVQVAHPGWALTPGVERSLPGFRRVMGPLLRTPEHGADTIAWLALTPEPLPTGQLWHDRRPRSPHRLPWTRYDAAEVARLWDRVSRDAGVELPAELALPAAR